MPTYQYACTECGHRFEQFQAFSDASLTDCPVCAGKLRKVYGSVGVVFKGSGFYRTDSRSAAAGGEKSEKSEKADAAATSTDSSKVAAKESTSASAKSSDGGSSSSAPSTNGSSTNGSPTNGSTSSKPAKTGKPAAAAKSAG